MTSDNAAFDTYKRARGLKASTMQNVSIPQEKTASSDHPTAAASLEDSVITTLRGEGKSWDHITTHLNERRAANREAPTWTEAAVYSRFIFHSSTKATPAREIGFEPRDYAHLRAAGSALEGTSKAGKKRVKDFQNATELSANIRKPAVVADDREERAKETALVKAEAKGKGKAKARGKGKGKDEERRKGESIEEVVKMDEVMVELLMQAVAKVERNFWVFVADEVEREAGKYVEPKELEKVFHGI